MFKRKTISSRKIGELQNYSSYSDLIKPKNKKTNLVRIFVVIFCIIIVGFFGKYILQAAQIVGSQIEKGAVNIVSNSLGEEMKTDAFGNVNIMIIGYGGENHAGGTLADSIMVASRNPELGALTMISVPRDLYVTIPERKIYGRINELFARGMGGVLAYETGAKYMENQLEAMMGLEIEYYALVDFNGFEGLINSMGGVDIFVEKPIRDTTYPDGEIGYKTFQIGSGRNHIDGETALMYARSRHTTSDFARSLRQQQIIKAIMKKMTSRDVLLSPSKLKELYASYTEMVNTNIQMDEMIGMSKYAYDLEDIFSFGFTNECSNASWKLSIPACFLYAPPKEKFGGAAVLIPASPGAANASFFDYTKNFALFVAHNQEYLIEGAKIVVQNGIEKSHAQKLKKKLDGHATKIGVKLRKYGFTVIDVENALDRSTGTVVYIVGTGEYKETIDTLKYFVPITTVTQAESGHVLTTTPGADLVIVLGNDYLDKTLGTYFSYYK